MSKSKGNDWNIPPRYQLREMLGAGSYGCVRAAFDTDAQIPVAIKRINQLFDDLTDCKRVLREICILNRLKHDLVVMIKDIVVPNDINSFGEISLVFEYVPSDFKKLIRSPLWLSELHVKTLLYNLLMAMKYAHSAGVYHRDLKPANCLVNEECIVKVCDFGLARTVQRPKGHKPLNRSKNKATEGAERVSGVDEVMTAKKEQKMTTHVVTRWYRAPELILLNENYSGAIDVWSIGCIFAELMEMIKGNTDHVHDRTPIFPGGTCFPLSPDRRRPSDYRHHAEGSKDQLNLIFNILGSPTFDDIKALERQDAKKYLEYFSKREPRNLADFFPKSSVDAIDLLKRMLVFNPAKRISVEDSLKHPFFAEIRHPELEREASKRVILPFEDNEHMTERELRYYFLKEMELFHPDLHVDETYLRPGELY